MATTANITVSGITLLPNATSVNLSQARLVRLSYGQRTLQWLQAIFVKPK